MNRASFFPEFKQKFHIFLKTMKNVVVVVVIDVDDDDAVVLEDKVQIFFL